MALLDSELQRIRAELGYPVLGVSAEPYVSIVAIFNSVIQQYITSGAKTTCATSVAAPSAPTLTSLTLADATGFHPGDRVYLDVDARQEASIVESVSGSAISLLLSLPHAGTYPVTVEGGEAIIRDILRQILQLAGPGGSIERARKRAGLKKVDDLEFHGGGRARGSTGTSSLETLIAQREYLRDELAGALGVERMNKRAGSGICEAY